VEADALRPVQADGRFEALCEMLIARLSVATSPASC